MENCIFCKISKKEISSKIVFEDDEVVAFHDMNPIVPVHILVIPKKHIASISEITAEDRGLMGNMIWAASEIARKSGISDNGYKLLFRVGKDGGQEVPHVHLHLLGGARMHEEIRTQ